eukprot:1157921-Pelagomonas_calceolata.AAC.9
MLTQNKKSAGHHKIGMDQEVSCWNGKYKRLCCAKDSSYSAPDSFIKKPLLEVAYMANATRHWPPHIFMECKPKSLGTSKGRHSVLRDSLAAGEAPFLAGCPLASRSDDLLQIAGPDDGRAQIQPDPASCHAVRAALASFRSSQDHLAFGSTGGLVSSALRDHALGLAATPYGARAAAVASQDNSLRNSMARLERLTASTKAALALRQQQSTVEGFDEAEQGNGAASDEGSNAEMSDDGMSGGAGTGRSEGSSASAPGSKYLELIRARAQARAAIAEESEHGEESN